jgi:CRISPR-associated protein (TIGR02710 family)
MSTKTKAMIISVGTGKEGKDIAHGICFSIQQHHPDFLVFLNTERSRKDTMPFITEFCSSKGRQWKEVNIDDADDVEGIVVKCEQVIEDLLGEGYQRSDIAVDYTSGTKAMSAGLTIASVRKRVGALSYISGKRGEGGRVISGTERMLSIVPNQLFATDLFREAVDAFNSYHFDVSLRILEETKNLLSDADFLEKVQVLELLSKAYGAWDRFVIKEAFQILKSIRHDSLLKEWKIYDQVELNKQALYQEKEKLFCPERISDLLENAIRRGEEERKFDDAVARLYRTCECLAQFEIDRLGLYHVKEGRSDPSNLDLSRLNMHLRDRYSKFTDAVDGKTKLPLRADYSLLMDLSHPIGIFFRDHEAQFNALMGLRNLSILAHGFNPISEEVYKKMLDLVENLMGVADLKKRHIREMVRFPKINITKSAV